MSRLPVVVAITGASGAIYAVRLLDLLLRSGADVHLSISPAGQMVLEQELDLKVDLERFLPASLAQRVPSPAAPRTEMERVVAAMLDRLGQSFVQGTEERLKYFHHRDYRAPIASGSFRTAGMVICPCSGNTLSAIAHGASGNLIQRAADVHLKERRRLILVPRETPLSPVHLENLQRAGTAGAIVLPAMPGWYHGVESLGDLIDFVVARILDQLGFEHELVRRWPGTKD